jgi:tetratricopeptide (TPR) repeat protein
VYQRHGQPDAAVLEFAKALELDPNLAAAAYNLAWIQFHAFKRVPAARAALAQAAAAHPDAGLQRKIRALERSVGDR